MPQTTPTDDVFFQPELGWSVLGVVGPDLDLQALGFSGLKWDCSRASLQALDVALLCKSKKEGGSARASPVATPIPKSVSF